MGTYVMVVIQWTVESYPMCSTIVSSISSVKGRRVEEDDKAHEADEDDK